MPPVMPHITFSQPDGTDRTIEAEVGRSLMEAARAAGILGIDAICGGACMCATCQIHVQTGQPGGPPPPDSMEQDLLDVAQGGDVDSESRLACQITVTSAMDGLRVRVAKAQG